MLFIYIKGSMLMDLLTFSITAIFISVMTARWIICPIRRLNHAAKTFARGKWDLTKLRVDLDRKALAEIAVSDPAAFSKIVAMASQQI